MKLLTALAAAALTFAAAPAQAQRFPVWADVTAESVCTYLDMGADFKTAALQGVSDNLHWKAEMQASHKRGLLRATLSGATAAACPAAVDRALGNR